MFLFLVVPWVGLQSVSGEFPGHNQFLFCFKSNHNIAYAKRNRKDKSQGMSYYWQGLAYTGDCLHGRSWSFLSNTYEPRNVLSNNVAF